VEAKDLTIVRRRGRLDAGYPSAGDGCLRVTVRGDDDRDGGPVARCDRILHQMPVAGRRAEQGGGQLTVEER
jgi:hypothetical protein